MITHTDTLILGAGPAGLAAALAMPDQAVLLESGHVVGGMSTTLAFAGAVFDIGGHSFHTPHPHVRDLVFDALDMFEQDRDARCFHAGEWIPFPFQQHFERLSDPKIVTECRQGLADRPDGADASDASDGADFQDFIDRTFGPGVSGHFMTPYNRKVWGHDLRRMDAGWTGQRVPSQSPSAQASQGTDGQRRPLQPKSSVAYPAKGGFEEIFLALGRKIRSVKTNTQIRSIDTVKKVAQAANGDRFTYKSLVSTLPLPRLLACIEGVPASLQRSVSMLEATSLHLVLVVINRPVDTPIQRIYSAEAHVAAHKLAVNHNSSDFLRGLPVHGVAAEISDLQSRGKTAQTLEKETVENLLEMGILGAPGDVVATTTKIFSHAYPVPTHARAAIVRDARAWLRDRDIHIAGRFGEWDYINSDEALHRGLSVARDLQR